MGKPGKPSRTVPRRLKGFRDISAVDLLARDRMIAAVRKVYERYGFVPLETPVLEYVDALGKFLPEADQPDAGIFSFRDEDEEWVALRYDLTAPLSRFVAMNPELPRPFRRYQVGPVFRMEKPGPGRFREFYQFDFDSVGTASMLADAECCMIMCDTLEELGFLGQYIIRVNNRKVLNGVLEKIAGGSALDPGLSIKILRCVDKLDRVGLEGVRALLGPTGRRDESGDFMKGVGLAPGQIDIIMQYLSIQPSTRTATCDELEKLVGVGAVGREGVSELREIDAAVMSAGYSGAPIFFDPTVVRGLAYYTGPVFEGELTFKIKDEEGQPRHFGSVFGGGRYDDLVERFTGQKVPATGASIGVDRLLAALKALGRADDVAATAPVLVTRLDKNLTAEYQRMTAELRAAGINAELYVGTQGIGKQFKYAADTGKIVAIVMGDDEMKAGQVSIKDLRLGDALSKEIGPDRRQWLEQQPAQFTVSRVDLVRSVRETVARHGRN